MPEAIRIIHDEHRALAAVLQGLLHLVAEIDEGRMKPDFRVLAAMLHYIDAFPEKLHHPKEDEFLYRLLRARLAEPLPLLDELESEHVHGRTLIEGLRAALDRFQAEGGASFPPFRDAARAYAEFHWTHMRKEEDEILPLAARTLTDDDWATIDAAFTSNSDPIVGTPASREFRTLFRRIVHLAPPPIGVGAPAR